MKFLTFFFYNFYSASVSKAFKKKKNYLNVKKKLFLRENLIFSVSEAKKKILWSENHSLFKSFFQFFSFFFVFSMAAVKPTWYDIDTKKLDKKN